MISIHSHRCTSLALACNAPVSVNFLLFLKLLCVVIKGNVSFVVINVSSRSSLRRSLHRGGEGAIGVFKMT